MTADDLIAFARVLLEDCGGLRETTESYLRVFAAGGSDAKLSAAPIGSGKSTARAIYFVATGKVDRDLPRHERRVIETYADRLWERKKALAGVA